VRWPAAATSPRRVYADGARFSEEMAAETVRRAVRVAAGWSVMARGPVQPVLRGSGVDGAALWRDAERLLWRCGQEGLGIGLSNESGSNRGVAMLCVCERASGSRCAWHVAGEQGKGGG